MKKILIANRGEIACRIIRSCRDLGLATVAVHSEADAAALHVASADQAVAIGPAKASESYLVAERILAAARETGADAIHPGYGFLAENERFAEAVEGAGLIWIGPRPKSIADMGDKERARALAKAAGVPVLPGSARFAIGDTGALAAAGQQVGFPLLVKAAAGGGGIGMRKVDRPEDLEKVVASTQELAAKAFGDGTVYLEHFVSPARHVEIQVFGFGDGRAVHAFERDCSVQRRYQKIVEESPAPGLSDKTRAAMAEAAVALAASERYRGAGTVEFVVAPDEGFYFLEMNTRIQVEHPVTEMLTGLDLVAMQIRLAAGDSLDEVQQTAIAASGAAVEARIYAERPEKNFLPSPGPLKRFSMPAAGPDLRIDTGVREGDQITFHYDPMIAKLVAHGADRAAALDRLDAALAECTIEGVGTNIAFLRRLLAHPEVRAGGVSTGFVGERIAELTS
ncbi:MAG: biotin carboxylase N-terminal domain-containing protein [Sneathiellaceae bacterium]